MDHSPGSSVVKMETDPFTSVSEKTMAKQEPTPYATKIKKEPVAFDSGETEAKLEPGWPAFETNAGVYLISSLWHFGVPTFYL